MKYTRSKYVGPVRNKRHYIDDMESYRTARMVLATFGEKRGIPFEILTRDFTKTSTKARERVLEHLITRGFVQETAPRVYAICGDAIRNIRTYHEEIVDALKYCYEDGFFSPQIAKYHLGITNASIYTVTIQLKEAGRVNEFYYNDWRAAPTYFYTFDLRKTYDDLVDFLDPIPREERTLKIQLFDEELERYKAIHHQKILRAEHYSATWVEND